MQVLSTHAYRIWAKTYDQGPNPLIALEQRLLSSRLPALCGKQVLDVGTGTGRWLKYASECGAVCAGVDACDAMLFEASEHAGIRNKLIAADVCALPVRSGVFDLAISSFVLGYISNLSGLFRELARVAPDVIVSDLHPSAAQAGWSRGFKASGRSYTINTFTHSLVQIRMAASNAGLHPLWELHARFGVEEFGIFKQAGKADRFESVSQVPAVYIAAWNRG